MVLMLLTITDAHPVFSVGLVRLFTHKLYVHKQNRPLKAAYFMNGRARLNIEFRTHHIQYLSSPSP